MPVDIFAELDDPVQGDDFSEGINVVDEGKPVDITGWTFWFTIKENRSDSDANAAYQQTVTDHDNPKKGKTNISIPSSDSQNLVGTYDYDIQFETSSGDIRTPVLGSVEFVADVTSSPS